MPESSNRGGESEVRYKKVVQLGVSTIVNNEPQSVIVTKVLCTRVLMVDINKCFRCPHNEGLLNQYLVQCSNDQNAPLPDEITKDVDYPEVKSDGSKSSK